MGNEESKPLAGSLVVVGNDHLSFRNNDAITKGLRKDEKIVFTC